MGHRWVAPRGWEVELIQLDNRHVFRVRQYQCLSAYCRTVREVEKVLEREGFGVTVADLVEMLPTAKAAAP